MDATIIDENDKGVAIDIIDNNSILHEISIFKKGEITYHDQDGYADDPVKRTEAENEHINQARRFAKFYVYRECGYDTVEHIANPDYIDTVRQSILELSNMEFEQLFGALHTQLRSHHEPVSRPVDPPAGVRKPDAVIYELDTYLGVDIAESGLTDQAKSLAEAHGLDYEAGTTATSGAAVRDGELEEWTAFGEELTDLAAPEEFELEVSAVSGIHVGYPNARGEHEVERADRPLERDPDARLELLPADPGSLEGFREYLDHHLRCQVRDCYVGMGLVPPEPYRVVGFGKFIYARRYDHYDLYPRFHLRESDHNAAFR